MRRNAVFGQFIALMAAAVMVMTAIYIYVLWRNQSPDRVMHLGAGHILYRTSAMAIGSSGPERPNVPITLLRFSPEGGWVSAGTGQWMAIPSSKPLVELAFIPNNAVELAGAAWFCAVQTSAQITAIELINPAQPNRPSTFDFHHGGIIEPVLVDQAATIRGLHNGHTVFSVRVSLPVFKN